VALIEISNFGLDLILPGGGGRWKDSERNLGSNESSGIPKARDLFFMTVLLLTLLFSSLLN